MNDKSYDEPILVTGGARSGTTWVGHTIAKSPSIRYVHEPFNISSPMCFCGTKFDYWYYYIPLGTKGQLYSHIKHTIGSVKNKYLAMNHIREAMRTKRVRPLSNYLSGFFKTRSLVKDPLALFSSEWLADSFDMRVIVLIRHPAAVVNSYLQLNWSHPFSHFIHQPLLLSDLLYPYEGDIENYASNTYDIIDQISLLWKLQYYVIRDFQQIHKDWIFVRHEDLSRDSITGFDNIYDQLGLKYCEKIRRSVEENSNHRYTAKSEDPYSIQRNSSQVVRKWKTMLKPVDIERIRRQVEEVSCDFYSDEDW
jgi:hypothetical protein